MSTLGVDTLSSVDNVFSIAVKDIASNAKITALPLNLIFNQPKSTNFWIDVHPSAKIHRINDRIFMGAAADNDGKITSTSNSTNKDWLELTRGSTTNNAQFVVLSQIGQGAIIGGSRTSDSGLAGSMGSIGVQAWGINDNTVNIQTTYGAYIEARRLAGAGPTHGFEVDVVNFGTVVSLQPYNMFQAGLTAGAWIASGGEYTTNRASAAIAITNNGSTWDKGIIFHSTSLEGTDGITGSGTAMEMAKGHVVRWMFGSGSLGATISSSVSADASSQRLLFADTGFLIQNSNNISMLQVDVSSGFVNGLKVSPAAAGIGPTLTAQGSDTNIDLRLASKGTGLVDFRGVTAVASAGSQVGYVVLKFNGSSLKVPVYNS